MKSFLFNTKHYIFLLIVIALHIGCSNHSIISSKNKPFYVDNGSNDASIDYNTSGIYRPKVVNGTAYDIVVLDTRQTNQLHTILVPKNTMLKKRKSNIDEENIEILIKKTLCYVGHGDMSIENFRKSRGISCRYDNSKKYLVIVPDEETEFGHDGSVFLELEICLPERINVIELAHDDDYYYGTPTTLRVLCDHPEPLSEPKN